VLALALAAAAAPTPFDNDCARLDAEVKKQCKVAISNACLSPSSHIKNLRFEVGAPSSAVQAMVNPMDKKSYIDGLLLMRVCVAVRALQHQDNIVRGKLTACTVCHQDIAAAFMSAKANNMAQVDAHIIKAIGDVRKRWNDIGNYYNQQSKAYQQDAAL
jgi:cytochrome c553